ncbi:MAG: hypothetical protein E6Q97_32975 [Desulfurellales bacterium]|nr:MAG: hypothetical protein E6Q97_32975 [Desulfurellales bacterium]
MKEQLGKVRSIFFGREDHGILTFMVQVDFGGSTQGFGGYSLDIYDKELKRRVGHAAGTDLVLNLLNLFGVDELQRAEGMPVFAIRDEGWGGKIIGLRTPDFDGGREFLIKDWQKKWFPNEME